MDTMLRTEIFTEKEQHLIDMAIAKLREDRKYGTKPSFYHDAILIGCKSILTDKAR